jgi:hypothetical protein
MILPRFVQAIGTDRYLTEREVMEAAGEHRELAGAWHLYRRMFDGFCETQLDPMFHRFRHPARVMGSPVLNVKETVVVVGNGPSATRQMPALTRVRDRVRLFTSPRGADLLAAHGLIPDLVLVEHRTALDAHHSARHVDHEGADGLAAAPLVAADWRTPAAMLARVSADRLFVPDIWPTWGAWPATAVALAAEAGAGRIALLGIDLGTAERSDPAFEPLAMLLSLLARLLSGRTFDCGIGGAVKDGWAALAVDGLAASTALGPLEIHRRAAPPVDARIALAADALGRLAPVVARAQKILALALAARARTADVVGMREAAAEMFSWQRDRAQRVDLQETLGLSFLPRLWRIGMDLSLGAALWRPLMLATHELVNQSNHLAAEVGQAAA